MQFRKAGIVKFKVPFIGLLAALSSATYSQPQPRDASLQSLYETAQHSQQAGDLAHAQDQYRDFLAAALDELANGNSWAGYHAKATALFEEAVALAPSAPKIKKDYAAAELRAGNLEHARALAKDLLSQNAADSLQQAQIHEILGLTLHKMYRDQEARTELDAALKLDPSRTNQYNLATVCLGLDDEACAVRIFDAMEASDPDNPALLMEIGLAYGNSDFTSRGVAEFKKVIALDPHYPEAHYCIAAALLAAGEDEKTLIEAEDALKKELAISPNDFLTNAALGKIEISYHRYPEAESYLKHAIALNAKNPDAFLYLGQMDYETNRLADAESNLRKAIQLTTDISRNHFQIQKAHFLLGRILMQQHRQAEAHAEMQIAHEFTDKALNKDKSKLSGMLPASGGATGVPDAAPSLPPAAGPEVVDPAAARNQTMMVGQLTPAIADSYNNLGAITASLGNFAQAEFDFEHAQQWRPTLEGLDLNLGHAAFMAADFRAAVPPLSRYIRSHPKDSGIRGPLAMSQYMTGNYAACLETLKAAGQSVTAIPQMQFIYADSLVKTGQLALGLARLQALEKADTHVAEVHRAIGEAFELRRAWASATTELNEAIRLNADDPESHYDLGKADLETGNTTGAISELETAVRFAPSEPRFHQELSLVYQRGFRPADAEKELQLYRKLVGAQIPATAPAPASTDSAN